MTPETLGARAGKRLTAAVKGDLRTLGDGSLRLSARGEHWALETSTGTVQTVAAKGREASNALRVLADHSDALVWVDTDQDTVEGLLFPVQRLAEAPRLIIPDALLERLPHLARASLRQWFTNEFLLGDGLVLFAGHGALDLEGSFDLIGAQSRWTLRFDEGAWLVSKVRRDNHRRNDAVWLRLDTPPVVISEHDRAADSALGSLSCADENSSYMQIWTDYQQAERELLENQAARLHPLPYVRHTLDQRRRRRRFQLKVQPPETWRTEETLPSVEASHEAQHVGVGRASLAQRDGHWWIETDNLDAVPPTEGQLRVDLKGDQRRLERQETALETLKHRRSTLPDLGTILDGAGRSTPTSPQSRWGSARVNRQLNGRALTEAQQRAVEVALNTPDIALIQGPPGTGKTTVIKAISTRLNDLGRHPVLLTSFQHDAVLRTVEGLVVGGIPAVRLGGRRGEDVDLSLRPLKDWLGNVRAQTIGALASATEPPTRDIVRVARRRLAHFRQAAGTPQIAGSLIERLRLELVVMGDLSVHDALDAAEAVIDAASDPTRPVDAFDPELIRERIAQQARSVEHFEDGGWLRARRLRMVITGLPLSDELRAQLDAACQVGTQMPPNFEATLDAIAEQLEPPPPVDHPALVHASLDKLDRALQQAEDRWPATVPDALAGFLDRLDTQAVALPELISRYAPAVGATLQQSVGPVVSEWHEDFDTVIVDEAARANPLDLLIPLVKGRRIILVGDQQQLPHMLEPRLERALEAGSGGTAGAVLKDSFFGRMWSLYANSPAGGIPRCVRLDRQFRMHPRIGTFISEQFYGGGLENGITEADRPPIPGLFKERPIAWFDVPRGKEQGRYHRPEEIEIVAAQVAQILQAEPGLSVGVISFYKQQVQRLQRRARKEGWPKTQVEVGTVDAFQGKEFDVVVLSTVRRGARVGFLRMPNRLNVAMSRAMRALVVVGDAKTVGQIPALKAFEQACREEHTYVVA